MSFAAAKPRSLSALWFRVAADEALLLTRPDDAEARLADLGRQVEQADPHGIVLDRTDAFTGLTLAGEGAAEAFRRLSAVPLPGQRPVFLQALVAHVPAKVVALEGVMHAFVSSTLGHHLYERVLQVSRDLAVVEASPSAIESPAGIVT